MIEERRLLAIAGEILDARERASALVPYQGRVAGFDVDGGYAVSGLIHRSRLESGFIPLGRKIGFTNAAMWDVYGVRAPIWSYVYDRTVTHLAGDHGECALSSFVEPKIEPEIVVHFHTAPPSTDDLSAILSCVDWIAHGFEIVQSHFPDWRFQIADTIANCALHGHLFVGTRVPVAELGASIIHDLAQFSIELCRGDQVIERGGGSNVLGHPLAAIAHLIKLLEAQPRARPIQADELVTTGTLTAAMPIIAGQSWRTQFKGIALAGLELTCRA